MKRSLLFIVGILFAFYGAGLIASCSDDEEEGFAASVTGIKLNKSEMELMELNVDTLVAEILMDGEAKVSVVWASSADSIATVDDFGVVTAVKEGNAVITATTFGEPFSAECSVTVTKRPILIERLQLDTASVILTCYDGKWDNLQLNATIYPKNADGGLLWTSSDENVATVTESGLVQAVAQGSAIIWCQAADNESCKDSCRVRVVRENGVIGVRIVEADAEIALIEGNTKTLTAEILPEDAEDKTVTWTSSDPSVLTVENTDQLTARITAVKAGDAMVILKSNDGGFADTCKVAISSGAVTGLTGLQKTLVGTVGKTETVSVTVLPDIATNKTVVWSSSDKEVVSIEVGEDSRQATLNYLKVGSATITATSESNPTVSVSCNVTVKRDGIAVDRLSGLPETLNAVAGKSGVLSVMVWPQNATNKTIVWSTNNESVVKLTPRMSGTDAINVNYLKAGTAVVTATSEDNPDATMSCTITVTGEGEVAVTHLTGLPETSNGVVGKSTVLNVIVNPTDASNKNVKWTSSDETIATVQAGSNSQQATVTYLKEGIVKITATSEANPEATMSCTITVTKEGGEVIAVTGLSGLPSTANGTVGKTGVLSVTVNPSNATNQTVIWKSSDETIATVRPYSSGSENATVTYLKEGTVVITATSEDNPSATMSCTVTVKKDESGGYVAVTHLAGLQPTLNSSVGKRVVLQVSVYPTKATNKKIIWKSSDESIATATPRTDSTIANVDLKKAGTVTITATSEDNPEATMSCVITVSE